MMRSVKDLPNSAHDLLAAMPDATFIVDSYGSIVFFNALAERMFGYSADELYGRSINELIPERFQHLHAAHCSDYFAHPRVRSMGAGLSLRAVRKDGTEFPVEIGLSPISAGAETLVIGAIRDISHSEKRYRAIFEQVAVGVVHSNEAGRLLDVNARFCELTGYSRTEALELDVRRLMHRDDLRKGLEARTCMLNASMSGHDREIRLIRKDGSDLWTRVTTSLIRNADGRPVHFISLIHDISRQVQAETGRAETELRFRQVTENIREVFWLIDPTKNEILYVSPAYEGIWGRSPSALYSSPGDWLEAIHPEDRPRVFDAARTQHITLDYDVEYRILRPDGGTRWVRDRSFPVRDAEQRIVRVAGVAEDITERKLASDALRESERRFRRMLQTVDLVALMLDTNARITYCNDYLLQLTGRTREEVFGASWIEMFLPSDAQEKLAGLFGSLLADRSDAWHYENDVLTRSGERRRIRWNNTILRSPAGDVIGTASIGENVTELRWAEAEVERTLGKLRRALQSTIEVVTTIGELRDPYTHGHEHRVGEIATAIAIELGLPAGVVEGVRIAGYLHDVGKISIPSDILSKPRRLSDTEFELVKDHAQQSYEILKGVEFPWPVAEAAWQHHERLDGSGYPRGLQGDAIILEARILAVADTVEAMSSHRPYRPGLGLEAALAEIEENRGRLYDDAVVDACLRLIRAKGYQLPA